MNPRARGHKPRPLRDVTRRDHAPRPPRQRHLPAAAGTAGIANPGRGWDLGWALSRSEGKREQPEQGGLDLPAQQEFKFKKKKGCCFFFSSPCGPTRGTHECCAPLSYLSYSTPCLVLFPRGQFSHSGNTPLPSGLVFLLFPSVSPGRSGVPCSAVCPPRECHVPMLCGTRDGYPDIPLRVIQDRMTAPQGWRQFLPPTGVLNTSGTSG